MIIEGGGNIWSCMIVIVILIFNIIAIVDSVQCQHLIMMMILNDLFDSVAWIWNSPLRSLYHGHLPWKAEAWSNTRKVMIIVGWWLYWAKDCFQILPMKGNDKIKVEELWRWGGLKDDFPSYRVHQLQAGCFYEWEDLKRKGFEDWDEEMRSGWEW